jgi:hypothetical protein
MKLTPLQRRIGLGCAAALTIAMTVVTGDDRPVPVESPAPPAGVETYGDRSTVKAEQPARIELTRLARLAPAAEGVDVFAAKSWNRPRAVVAVKLPPPEPPAAPPLPFEYVGQMEGREGVNVFLSRGGEFVTAKAGQQLDDDYRLETVSPQELIFVYLPLGERQTLSAEAR